MMARRTFGAQPHTWLGRCEYPGKKPFFLGTVVAESDAEAVTALQALWAEISPHPMPPILQAIRGQMIVQLEGEAA